MSRTRSTPIAAGDLPPILDADGRVTAVEWGTVDARTHQWQSPPQVARVEDVVAAIRAGQPVLALFPSGDAVVPGGNFVEVAYDIGWQTIALDGPPSLDRDVQSMLRLPG